MSHCSDIEPFITPYVDDDIDAATRARVAAHLERCGACRRAAVAEQEVRSWMRAQAGALRGAAPANLVARCVAAARPVPVARAPWRSWPVAASLLVTLVGGGLWFAGTGRSVMAAQLRADHERCFRRDVAPMVRPSVEVAGKDVVVPASEPDRALELRTIRRCRVGQLPTAHALYRSHGRQVSLFVASDAEPSRFVPAIMGYDVRTWRDRGRQYALVGQLGSTDMDELERFMRAEPR